MKRTVVFQDGFNGILQMENGTLRIGKGEGQAMPYEMTYGALASCLYSTFLGILEKQNLSIDGARIEVDGEKRETVPTTLKQVHIDIEIQGKAEKKAEVEQAFDQATQNCSMYQTIAKVAAMSWTLSFAE